METITWSDSSGLVNLEIKVHHLDMLGSGSNDEAIAEILPDYVDQLKQYDTKKLLNLVNDYGTDLPDDSTEDTIHTYVLWLAIWDLKESEDLPDEDEDESDY